MPSHQDTDQSCLAVARLILERIDADPAQAGLARARAACVHGVMIAPLPVVLAWPGLRAREGKTVRTILLRDDDESARLRHNSSFTGAFSPRARRASLPGPASRTATPAYCVNGLPA